MIALLLALSPGVAAFVPMAIALSIALAVATTADAILGPAPSALRIARMPPEHFALGVRGELSYAIENRSPRALRAAIIEMPAAGLSISTVRICKYLLA